MSAVITASNPLLLSRSAAMAIATCAGKASFVTHALAARVANRMRGQGKNRHRRKRSGIAIRPYRWDECGGWHLGGEA